MWPACYKRLIPLHIQLAVIYLLKPLGIALSVPKYGHVENLCASVAVHVYLWLSILPYTVMLLVNWYDVSFFIKGSMNVCNFEQMRFPRMTVSPHDILQPAVTVHKKRTIELEYKRLRKFSFSKEIPRSIFISTVCAVSMCHLIDRTYFSLWLPIGSKNTALYGHEICLFM